MHKSLIFFRTIRQIHPKRQRRLKGEVLSGEMKQGYGHMRDTLNGVSRNSIRLRRVILLRSCIRLRRVIFATRVFRRIEYHCEALPCNITSRQGNITLRVSEEYHF